MYKRKDPSSIRLSVTHERFEVEFTYNVSSYGNKYYFRFKFKHIKKAYFVDDAKTLCLKLKYPVPHYLEERKTSRWKTFTRTTPICNEYVMEPKLSNYYKLAPVISFRPKGALDGILDYFKYHAPSIKWHTELLQCGKGCKASIGTKDSLFKRQMAELDFDLQYLVLCLLSAKKVRPESFPFELFEFLKSDPAKGKKALKNLLRSGRKFESIEMLKSLPYMFIKLAARDFMCCRRIVITPSVILFQPPSLSESCRFFRKFADPSHALTASFKSHDLHEFGYSAEFVGYVKCLLNDGLRIGTRNFVFLGYSQSQIREHTCWLIWDAVDVCKSLGDIGDFTLSDHPAKVAARMGHAFTSTRPVATLTPQSISQVPDVQRHGHIFTDGVGSISSDLCKRCGKYEEAVAYQVRIGGYKGVLKLGLELNGESIAVRPSMKKFESKDTTLEIIRPATYMGGYLNRELILLLETLGVKRETFVNLQNEYIRNCLKAALEDKSLRSIKQLSWVEHLRPLILYATELKPHNTDMQFVKHMVTVQVAKETKNIRKKARVHIEKSCRLIGVCDELGVLEPGEVFVQFVKSKNEGPLVLVGKVLVTRNPCLHPGDIRILNAVNAKEYYHLFSVIVFSSKGVRPAQNMMSSGDLDGDIYFICWDNRIFPKQEVPPATVQASKESSSNGYVQNNMTMVRDNIIDLFCNYFRNNYLGFISALHLVHADISQNGALSKECLELERLHSTAVDFPKHGKNVSREEVNKYKMKAYPDFMARKDKDQYESKKALGIMFRSAKTIFDEAMDKYREMSTKQVEYVDKDLLIEGREKYLELAFEQYKEYAIAIRSLLKMNGVKTEAEILSGSIIKLDRVHRTKNREHEIKREVTHLIKDMILRFNTKISTLSPKEQLQLASARYAITYSTEAKLQEAMNSCVEECEMWKAYSYPWVISGNELVQIKSQGEFANVRSLP